MSLQKCPPTGGPEVHMRQWTYIYHNEHLDRFSSDCDSDKLEERSKHRLIYGAWFHWHTLQHTNHKDPQIMRFNCYLYFIVLVTKYVWCGNGYKALLKIYIFIINELIQYVRLDANFWKYWSTLVMWSQSLLSPTSLSHIFFFSCSNTPYLNKTILCVRLFSSSYSYSKFFSIPHNRTGGRRKILLQLL